MSHFNFEFSLFTPLRVNLSIWCWNTESMYFPSIHLNWKWKIKWDFFRRFFKHSVRTISHTIQMSSLTSKAPSAALSTTILAAGAARPTMPWNSKSMLTQREDPVLWKTLSFVAVVGVQINNLLECKLSLEFSWPSDRYLGLMDGWTGTEELVRCKLTTRPIFAPPEGLLELEDKWTLLKLGCLQSFKTLVESVVMSSKQKLSVERLKEKV